MDGETGKEAVDASKRRFCCCLSLKTGALAGATVNALSLVDDWINDDLSTFSFLQIVAIVTFLHMCIADSEKTRKYFRHAFIV